jgi:hypothetical protein
MSAAQWGASLEETRIAALEEYVRLRKQQNILCVYGDLEEEDGA